MEGGREEGREGGREGRRKGGRQGGREEGREGGREERRKLEVQSLLFLYYSYTIIDTYIYMPRVMQEDTFSRTTVGRL